MSKKSVGRRRRAEGRNVAIILGTVAVLGLLGAGVWQNKYVAAQNALRSELLQPNEHGCVSAPVRVEMPGLERELCKSAAHVDGQRVQYEMDPPTSGPHWNRWVLPGFYTEPQIPEQLVHSLEHGNVVIYYDEERLEKSVIDTLRKLARKYNRDWEGVLVVPRTGGDHPLILTSWEHALRLDGYDKALVDQFVDEFRGRGPENPVRPLKP